MAMTKARLLKHDFPVHGLLFAFSGEDEVDTLGSGEQPCPSFPWSFCFLGVSLAGDFLGLFECFLLLLQGF